MKSSMLFKLAGSLVLLVFISLTFLYFTITNHVTAVYKDKMIAESIATAELLSGMVSAPLVFEQQSGAEDVLNALKSLPTVNYAAVLNAQQGVNSLFVEYGKPEIESEFRAETLAEFSGKVLTIIRPIELDGVQIGWLQLESSLQPLQLQLMQLYRTMAIAMVVVLSGTVLITLLVTRNLLDPLLKLRATSTLIAQTKDYSLRVEQKSDDEIGHLVFAFNSMLDDIDGFVREKNIKQQEILDLNLQLEDKVAERTKQLENSMNQLSETLQNLQMAQRQIIEQEKLASLGSLVAGVAHEINTPVGVAVTMSTTFAEKLQQFIQKVNTGQLRRTELVEFEKDSAEGLTLLQNALNKAARLIQSFKKVAVDQTSEERREFKLNEVIDEIVRTLRHQLKNRDIQYKVELEEEILMDSYPGPLGQVISNLFNNAVIHGFDGIDQGLIVIAGVVQHNQLTLKVTDNGLGISAKYLNRIFEPFVTSKLGQGGSGLGLHIVHNIVVNILGGNISVESNLGHGCCFTIQLPLIAPVKESRIE